jgi:RNA polymerase sigma factor (sigma-70 family)
MPALNLTPLTAEQRALVERHHALAYDLMRKLRPSYRNLDPDDLLIACEDGLIQAARHYREEEGKFSTYAYPWMIAATKRAVVRSRMIHVPEHYWHSAKVLKRLNPEHAVRARKALEMHRIASHSGDHGRGYSPSGVYAAPDHRHGPAAEAEARDEQEHARRWLGTILTAEQSRAVWAAEIEGLTLAELGRREGISRTAACRRYHSGMKRLCAHHGRRWDQDNRASVCADAVA